jgi:chromosome segregation ATPase
LKRRLLVESTKVETLTETNATLTTDCRALRDENEFLRRLTNSLTQSKEKLARQLRLSETPREDLKRKKVRPLEGTIESLNSQIVEALEVAKSHEKSLSEQREENRRLAKCCRKQQQRLMSLVQPIDTETPSPEFITAWESLRELSSLLEGEEDGEPNE